MSPVDGSVCAVEAEPMSKHPLQEVSNILCDQVEAKLPDDCSYVLIVARGKDALVGSNMMPDSVRAALRHSLEGAKGDGLKS